MYTIFKNDSSVILTDDEHFLTQSTALSWSRENMSHVLNSFLANEGESFVLIGKDLDSMWSDFKKNFKLIQAAGGVVRNAENSILFIFRNEKWDLPKGKLDPGESFEMAAIREVEEECGFNSLVLGDFIQTTYHIYEEKERQILKVSKWYEMFSDETALTPQLEEGITELRWVSPDSKGEVLENTYPNIELLICNLKTY